MTRQDLQANGTPSDCSRKRDDVEQDFFGIPAKPPQTNAKFVSYVLKAKLILLYFRRATAAFSLGTRFIKTLPG